MGWLSNLWRSAVTQPTASARRSHRAENYAAAEFLEPRLCLGGMPAPDMSDWSSAPPLLAPDLSPPAEPETYEVAVVTAPSDPPADAAATAQTAGATNQYAAPTSDPQRMIPATGGPSLLSAPRGVTTAASVANALPDEPPAGPVARTSSTDSAARGTSAAFSANNSVGTGGAAAAAAPQISAQGNPTDSAHPNDVMTGSGPPWWQTVAEPVVVHYDFRDTGSFQNQITTDEETRAADALKAWSDATGGKIQFVRDTAAPATDILNIGVGDLGAFGYSSGANGTLGLGGGSVQRTDSGGAQVRGTVWLDAAESWDVNPGDGTPEGTVDLFTAVGHEVGHVLGYSDAAPTATPSIMEAHYGGARSAEAFRAAVAEGNPATALSAGTTAPDGVVMHPLTPGDPQLAGSDVAQLLKRAAAATSSNDAIIAVVDRQGNILGVRAESGALAALPDEQTLVFAIDGAVAEARTGAFFANNNAPLTSRLVQFIAQSTVTQREVESNPNVGLTSPAGERTAAEALASTVYGPGFVAPIGLGGHFPPGIPYVPPVDLFAIEHTNRDSIINAGPDHVKGTPDDVVLPERFNANPAFVPPGQEVSAPESYGFVSGRLVNAQARGIGTLPGGVPLVRNGTVVGGIGVFFPGSDGYATHEQGFVPGIGQTQEQRLNADRALEAEYIAYAAAGGSQTAEDQGIAGAKIRDINGVAPVEGLDLPFGRIDLVGITLPIFGPTAGPLGLEQLLAKGQQLGVGDPNSGADQPLGPDPDHPATQLFYRDGKPVPAGWLVTPHDSTVDPSLTAENVRTMIENGIHGADSTRAAIRLPLGARTKMIYSVTDTSGEVLGLYRMPDATYFSIDVAVAKARNTAYYADPTELQPFDQVVPEKGAAFTNRTFRFLSEPRYPAGIDGTVPPPFSILNQHGINPLTAENVGAPVPAATFDPKLDPASATVLGYDAFFPNTNFQDPDDPLNQNGIVFFPGSTPIYKEGKLIGGLGVSGDGVDQDDVVTFIASQGFFPPDQIVRADETAVRNVRLPYVKFLRNPFG